MGFCSCLGRSILFILNIAFLAAGVALIVVGVVYKFNFDLITDALPDATGILALTPILVIVVGCVIAAVAFFGCCGAATRSICQLTTYIVFMVIIIILQVALSVFAFIQFSDNQTDFRDYLFDYLQRVFEAYSDNTAPVVDALQQELQCCGLNGTWYSSNPIPGSCCETYVTTCTDANAFSTGCKEALWSWLERNTRIIAIVAIALAGFEAILAIFAGCQIRAAKKRKEYA